MEEYKLVIGLGALAAYAIKFLQGSKYFPWITAEARKINIAAQAVLSLVSSLGISYSWNKTAGTLVITGLTLAAIFHHLIGWISQFAIQHGFTNLISLGQMNGFSMGLPAAAVPGKDSSAPAPAVRPPVPPKGAVN